LERIFQEFPEKIAAVIMEPMNVYYPEAGYLESVKEMVHANDAVLVFDEMITGCRFSRGGAQELFNVTPDLATFGKGLANGFPLSAIVGRKEIMLVMEDIFFSGTFGGETASLAAAKVVLGKIETEPVLKHLALQGQTLVAGINKLIEGHGVGHIYSTGGHPSWSFLLTGANLNYSKLEIQTLFLQEMFKRGILILGTHNMSYAHTDQDIDSLLDVYDAVFPTIKSAVENCQLENMLQVEPLQPLFTVR